MQCDHVFEQQPLSYSTDRAKITFLMGLLQGDTLAWVIMVREELSSVAMSYSDFTSEMRKMFDHQVQGKDDSKRLFSLQGFVECC